MRILVWLVRGLIFFVLFAFALNNQQDAVVRWFFGAQWRAPMVIVVLVAFAAGAAMGVLAMVPSWWRHRRVARRAGKAVAAKPGSEAVAPGQALPDSVGAHPPRDGL
jgi:lipopolysaccharide assembly protein A